MLTSEQVVVDNPFAAQNESVRGACLLDTSCVLYAHSQWILLTMQGVKVEIRSEDLVEGYQILAMDFRSLDNYHTVLWTGNLDDKRLIFRSTFDGNSTHNLQLSNALVMNHDRDLLFACTDPNSANVSLFQLTSGYSNCSHFHKDVGLI